MAATTPSTSRIMAPMTVSEEAIFSRCFCFGKYLMSEPSTNDLITRPRNSGLREHTQWGKCINECQTNKPTTRRPHPVPVGLLLLEVQHAPLERGALLLA